MRSYSTIVYEYKNSLYLNITNRCPNLCAFCIKTRWNMGYRRYDLKLENEPDVNELIKEVESFYSKKKYDEIVFCGYGEPTIRWDTAREFTLAVRKGKIKNVNFNERIRINTNGLGNLINKKDITIEMKGIINSLYISINTIDPKQWGSIMRPFEEYKDVGFESVIDFIKKAKDNVEEVVITAVELKEVDIKAVSDFALKLGLKFKSRPLLEEEND